MPRRTHNSPELSWSSHDCFVALDGRISESEAELIHDHGQRQLERLGHETIMLDVIDDYYEQRKDSQEAVESEPSYYD